MGRKVILMRIYSVCWGSSYSTPSCNIPVQAEPVIFHGCLCAHPVRVCMECAQQSWSHSVTANSGKLCTDAKARSIWWWKDDSAYNYHSCQTTTANTNYFTPLNSRPVQLVIGSIRSEVINNLLDGSPLLLGPDGSSVWCCLSLTESGNRALGSAPSQTTTSRVQLKSQYLRHRHHLSLSLLFLIEIVCLRDDAE